MVAAALSVVLTGNVAFGAGKPDLTPPPERSEVIRLVDLPSCEGAVIPNAADAAQLGYVGKPTVGRQLEAFVTEIVPMIPCLKNSNSSLAVGFLASAIAGGKPVGQLRPTFTLGCYVAGAVTQVTRDGVQSSVEPGVGTNPAIVEASTAAQYKGTCERVTSVMVSLKMTELVDGSYQFVTVANWVWKPALWKSDKGGWEPKTSINDFFDPSVELPIVCKVEPTGDDLFELIGSTIGQIVNWVPCMVIPVGWDRSGRIEREWNSGGTGNLQAAVDAAIPNGIECGQVASVPFFGRNIVLNTCAADYAPAWGKAALSWVFILGLGFLTVRRIMWAVGSRG